MNTSNTQQEWQGNIGHKLRKHRKTLLLSLNDLSRLSGVAVPALSHIENGNRDVKLSTLVRLTEALRINLSDLFSTSSEASPITPQHSGYDLGED